MRKEELMSYLAGIIDGDGSFSILRKQEKKDLSPSYYPCIQFSKSSNILPKLLHDNFGGRLSCVDRKEKSVLEYKWRLERSEKCRPFLEEISPYLHIKQEQAFELIRFIEDNPFKRGIRVTKEDISCRENARTRVMNLNARRDTKSKLNNSVNFSYKSGLFWSYLSGLLDTDGSFSIKKERRGIYSPMVLLSLINSKAINFIKNNCSVGSFFVVKAPQLLQKFYYRFGVYNRDEVVVLLDQVIPYLLHKKNSAEILRDFCNGYVSQGGRYLKTKEQDDFRENCYQSLVKSNGVYKSHLIDLELLPGDAGDNRAEAAEACTVNVVSDETPEGDAVL